jgi:predicted aconitase
MDAQTVQLEPIHLLVVSKPHAQLKTVHLDSTLLNKRQQRLTMGVPIVDSANILVPDKKLHALTKLVQPDSNLRRTTQLIIRMVARIVVKDINPEQVLKLVVQFKYVIRVNTLL